jgi:eukaryotic-like serine/threonine-protein kinase
VEIKRNKLYIIIGLISFTLFLSLCLDNPIASRHDDSKIHKTHNRYIFLNGCCSDQLLQEYSNSSTGIDIRYPDNWFINKTFPDKNSIIVFQPLNQTQKDSKKQDLKVIVDDVKPYILISSNNTVLPNETLFEFVKETIHSDNVTTDPNLRPITNLSIINNTNLGKYNAIKFEYESTEEGVPIKAMEIDTKINDTIYSFFYRAGQQDFEKYIPLVDKSIDSFRIIR